MDTLPKSLENVVVSIALLYCGGARLPAGMWEFRNDDTFGAMAPFRSRGASPAPHPAFPARLDDLTGYSTIAAVRVGGAVAVTATWNPPRVRPPR